MIARRLPAYLLVPGLVALCLSSAAVAAVVVVPPATPATTTLSNMQAGQPGVTYTFAQYQEAVNGRVVVGVAVEFPEGTNVSAATVPSTVGTSTIAGQTVNITFTPPIDPQIPFSFSINNITNHTTAKTFSGSEGIQLEFRTTNRSGFKKEEFYSFTAGPYTITAAPYISMTITTPDAGQSVDFGWIDPGVTTAAKSLTLSVRSSAQYTITRSVSGDDALLGLTPAWLPAGTLGTLRPAAPTVPSVFTDTFTLTPPWTTDPEIPLAANVTYTVVQ